MKTSGLDLHKDNIFYAIYDGKSFSAVKEFSTTTNSIRILGEYLQSNKVKQVAIGSTSMYWVPIWDILYECFFEKAKPVEENRTNKAVHSSFFEAIIYGCWVFLWLLFYQK